MIFSLFALAGRQAKEAIERHRAHQRLYLKRHPRGKQQPQSGHSELFLQAVAASGKDGVGMGLTPEAVERIKAVQRGLGMPRDIEIAITKDGIVICSDEDFDRDAFVKELEAAGIEVVKERVTICG